ncbi:MAG: nicotinate-nucleotide--dimethylbenzimidazole phosphoribosyltransferase [Candidatus Methanofishera endochildressiae]|uniref:Nicotinate-nucleotide--dimethylbenzimidazole phosphoribosyltransferase n=1 Tax=Candidatus Methanofishera endochildressiae TaxID=2738884 RepID=A0A7Z0SF08_9GAMM|nr:nicotinate-nucleotide--dimethylbenzimidazole phosphoribosyltransferase [Candidatus Methanofishera endochildressiae]
MGDGKYQHNTATPLSILQTFGGFEIAALTGAYLAAAQQQLPVVVDGFICSVAALVAAHINPNLNLANMRTLRNGLLSYSALNETILTLIGPG